MKLQHLFFLLLFFLQFSVYSQKLISLHKIDKYGFELSKDPGPYPQAQSITIKALKKQKFSIELNGSSLPVNSGVANAKITKNSIIKVYIKDTVFVGSYYIRKNQNLPVISLHLDYDKFVGSGGIIDGRMEEGNQKFGSVWDKNSLPVFFEYSYGQDNFGTECMVKPHGGFTLGLKEKSLLIYSDSTKGSKYLDINPFENKHFDSFEKIVLRTSGSDQASTRIKDITMASLARDMGLDYQDYKQSVLYVNGNYFGLYNIREKLNKEYLKYNFGADKDSTILLELSGDHSKEYRKFLNYIDQRFPEKSAFDSLNSVMHVEEYLNWIILQTHIQNIDSRGNIRFWKSSNLDNRWRWIFYDSDLGCDLGSTDLNYLKQRLSSEQTEWYNPTWATQILRDIVKYEPMKQFFINQYCYMLGSHLQIDSIQNRISKMSNNIAGEIPDHVMRRDQIHGEDVENWQSKIKSLRQFFTIRNENAYKHIMESFGLKKMPVFLTVQTNATNNTNVKAIRLKYSNEEFGYLKAKFFPEIPVVLIASNSDHLYQFDHWDYQNSKSPEITLKVDNTPKVTAYYKHRPYSQLHQKLFITQVSVKHTRKARWYGVGLHNKGDEIKNQTLYLWVQGEDQPIKLQIDKINSGGFIYFSNKPNEFSKKFKKKNTSLVPIVPNFNVRHINWVLADASMNIIDSAFIHFPDSLIRKETTITAYRNIEEKKWEFGKEISYDSKKGNVMTSSIFWWVIAAIVLLLSGFLIYWKKMRKNNNSFFIIIILLCGFVQTSVAQKKDKFGLDSVHVKLIDNKGKGYDEIYGLRNVRVILKNLVYRGGNNNPISVQNPLTEKSLSDLKKVGFNEVIYLYSKNYKKYYTPEKLDSINKAGLNYVCKPRLDSANVTYILEKINDRVNNKSDSMIYLHCWNGWHQSGWIASIILMQYCDYTNREALQYWASNTDKNYIGYDHVTSAIMNYKVNPKYHFSEQQKSEYCPCKDQEKLDKIFVVEDILANKPLNGYKPVEKNDQNAPEKLMENHPGAKTKYHTVKKGETLNQIAKKYGKTVSELRKLNKLNNENVIRTGQKIRVG
jgi:hypothetical protein